MKLTNDQRTRLKAAITAHPKWPDFRQETGMNSGQLDKAMLLRIAKAWGIDVDAIIGGGDLNDHIADEDARIEREMARPSREDMLSAIKAEPRAKNLLGDKLSKLDQYNDSDLWDWYRSLDLDRPMNERPKTKSKPTVSDADRLFDTVMSGPVETLAKRVRKVCEHAATPVVKEVVKQVYVNAPQHSTGENVVPLASVTATEKASTLFSIRSKALQSTNLDVWDAQDTPDIDTDYVFEPERTAACVLAMANGLRYWLAGPAGTGKTEFVRQVAARTKRSFVRIAFDGGFEAPDVVGGFQIKSDGSTAWQDGALTAAIRRPGTIILLDEISFARPNVLPMLQTLLDLGEMTIRETGERVVCAPGVYLVAADNTKGSGDDTGRYEGTRAQNVALIDRFPVIIEFDYLPKEREAKFIAARTGTPQAFAEELVRFASVTRTETDKGALTHGIGPRRLMSWATMMRAGMPCKQAFDICVFGHSPSEDSEIIRQLYNAHVNADTLTAHLEGRPIEPPATPDTVTPEGAAAARDFA